MKTIYLAGGCFWGTNTIDPTSLNHHGGDFGTQYRTGIYYTDDNDYIIAKDMLAEEQKKRYQKRCHNQ